MTKEEKLETSLKHKELLVLIKFSPHFIAILYAIYNLASIFDIDLITLGYMVHLSIFPWTTYLFLSKLFRYCWIHRLPLYYILCSEILTIGDNFLNYTIQESNIICLHLSIFFVLICGYTYYYLYDLDNKKHFKIDDR